MAQVLMYMTAHCPYCIRARHLLRGKGVVPEEIPVDRDREQMQAMMARSRRHTVPQIFIGDVHVGGYDDLARLDSRGELDSLLGL
jgi:glutaredoxin 3